MKILLTARGFLGSLLERNLKDCGHEVVVMGREYDVRDKNSFSKISKKGEFDLVIHNASIVSSVKSIDDPHTTYETNLMGTVNVLELCKKNKTPIIFMSSCKVQPNSRESLGSYGVSKICGELIVKDYWKIYGVPYIIVRPASIYGISQDGTSILGWITWFIKAAIHGYKIDIEGDGEQLRDSIFVEDLVDLIIKMVSTFYEGANEVYEAGLGISGTISVNWLIDYLQKRVNKPANKHYTLTRRGDPYSLIMNPEKTMRIWDWKPKYGIREGIDMIYDYYEKHPGLFTKK